MVNAWVFLKTRTIKSKQNTLQTRFHRKWKAMEHKNLSAQLKDFLLSASTVKEWRQNHNHRTCNWETRWIFILMLPNYLQDLVLYL